MDHPMSAPMLRGRRQAADDPPPPPHEQSLQKTTSTRPAAVSGAGRRAPGGHGAHSVLTGLLVGVLLVEALAWAGSLYKAWLDGPRPSTLRNLVYLTGQHPAVPTHVAATEDITHVALAFMPSSRFNSNETEEHTEWPLFTSVAETRGQFAAGTRVLVAIGGWGDTAGFEAAAATEASRRLFARNVAAMVRATGADGVDVDWEYPGGNGEDYRRVPNSAKAWQIEAYPRLLAELRDALGPDKIISAAVPGKPEDLLAFTAATVPRIMAQLDFLNVMTYDLMNRRDRVTRHHSGIVDTLAAVDAYVRRGCDAAQINFGLGFYVKHFETEHASCLEQQENHGTALGCRTLLMEDPETGADLGRAGAFSWHDTVPSGLEASFARAQTQGTYETQSGGYCYWDEHQNLWWTFDTPEAIVTKFEAVFGRFRLGGVFAWGLGEDAPEFAHLKAMDRGWRRHLGGRSYRSATLRMLDASVRFLRRRLGFHS